MKILLIIPLLFSAAVAQESFLSCVYFVYGDIYGCDLTINNPNGFNNFTEIGGIHLEGFTNADVAEIYRFSGSSTNIPRIICDSFLNLLRMVLFNTGIIGIEDNTLSGCARITNLYLTSNRISSISPNAFVNLRDLLLIDLDSNVITDMPENVFANQQNLTDLSLSRNPLDNIPLGLFRPLESLVRLYFGNVNLNSINNQWFATNTRLSYLNLEGNRITVSADSFDTLRGLTVLNLANNEINQIPIEAFTRLPNLRNLNLNRNNLTEIETDSFTNLEELSILEISDNPIKIIHNDAFRGLVNLNVLLMSNCRLRQLQSNYFENLGNLTFLTMNGNDIEELPNGVFNPLPNLLYLGLWNNRLKTLRRISFGALTSLHTLDLEGNIVNALDKGIIDDAVSLETLFFSGNLCASGYFGNFLTDRAQHLPMLDRCFSNMRYIIDTVTEGDGEYSFFEGPHPGIVFRVNTGNEVQIALTPFNFAWSPMIEIFIATTNNTRSTIRVNQEINVVTVPTPNIITQHQWNDFRITWANQNILVYRSNETFPFMSFTMHDFFPVNFYGLRAVETSASWSVQPFE